MSKLIVALDTPSARSALRLVETLGDAADFYKVGLELYTRAGPSIVGELRGRGKRVFLDLKLHDIPNTVAGAVRAAVELEVELLTVHAAGGRLMLEAARGAAAGRVRLLAVTVLTSLASDDVGTLWEHDAVNVSDQALRLSELAMSWGADGVVAAATEAAAVRERLGRGPLVVTPGIRPAGADRHDQKRVATPTAAVHAGADHLIVGRPVTAAAQPQAALAAILAEVHEAESAPA